MPAINTNPQRPHRDPPFEDEVEPWAMPIGRLGGIKFHLSYSIFVALAALVGMVMMVKDRVGNADLPTIALVGTTFWMAGWAMQLLVHCCFRFVGKVPLASLTIGLLGIESRTRSWSAPTALAVAATTTFSLVALGGMFLLTEVWLVGAQSLQNMLHVWTAPSLGWASSDSVWLVGTWLVLVQAICQMYPLPKSLGRLGLVAMVAVLSRESDETVQTRIARRVLQIVALITVVVVVASIPWHPNLMISRWQLMLLLALLLWLSARSPDVFDMIVGFGSTVDVAYDLAPASSTSLAARCRQSIRSVVFRRRARKALQRERGEAQDVARLDDVLDQLHNRGIDSLSSSDRALLQRVSQSLRQHRESDSSTSVEDSRSHESTE